ncbi:hypothetical protein B1R94_07810 [Mycolicibacterium litorale]|nr:hypothetical protein B1R94_07810 [Mycolicibacterium litorale]
MAWWSRNRSTAAAEQPSETRSTQTWSISDPAIVELLGVGVPAMAGVNISESSVLGLSSVYRAVSLIAGTIATLPMRTILTDADGHTGRTGSFLDNPGGPNGLTPFEWKETVLAHLLLHGNAYCQNLYGGAGQIVGLSPIHPLAVSNVEWEIGASGQPTGSKLFTVDLADGTQRVFNSKQLTHIPALSLDGLVGLSPITVARTVFGTTIAGDRAAGKMFTNGAMLSGLVTPEEDMTPRKRARSRRR